MKLDNKRTILTGFAFLSICAFWQMYNSIVPLILTNTFHLNETYSGAIMAADNVLALFLLPLFGAISDKTHTKIGKRMPFILFGTGLAIILMNLLPLIDNSYAAAPTTFKTVSFVVVLGLLLVAMGTYRSPAVALMPDITPKPLRSKGNAIINLMGALGGVIYLGVAAVMYPNSKVEGLAARQLSAAFHGRFRDHVRRHRRAVSHDQGAEARCPSSRSSRRSIPSGTSPRTTAAAARPAQARKKEPDLPPFVDQPVVSRL